MSDKLFIGDFAQEELTGKTVLVRVDYNVPLTKQSESAVFIVSNDARIRDSLRTLQFLLSGRAKVVLISHLGRPTGPSEEFSLLPAARRLQELIPDTVVTFCPNCVGSEADMELSKLREGNILLLENLRFHPEELNDDELFSQSLAQGKDLFVNDAFSACHRAHASVHAIANRFPVVYCGFALQKELIYLQDAVDNPRPPVAAIIGGIKVSSKLRLLEALLTKVDILCIGGAMVFTFYRALGHDVGDSFVEEDMVEHAGYILRQASNKKTIIRLATDAVIANTKQLKSLNLQTNPSQLVTQIVYYDAIPHGWQGLDIGPDSVRDFEQTLYPCQTIIWNGPLGKCEDLQFAHGTNEIIRILTECTDRRVTTIACGGDTVAAIENSPGGLFSHLSMGGGAALELLSGNTLPGVDVLGKRENRDNGGEVHL